VMLNKGDLNSSPGPVSLSIAQPVLVGSFLIAINFPIPLLLPGDLGDQAPKFLILEAVKYAAWGKYVPKLFCFALVKSWCRSRDKRIKGGRGRSGEGGIPRKEKRGERIQTWISQDDAKRSSRRRGEGRLRAGYYFYLP